MPIASVAAIELHTAAMLFIQTRDSASAEGPNRHRSGDTGPMATICGGHYVDIHQQYLHRNPYGYRFHANTGIPVPTTD